MYFKSFARHPIYFHCKRHRIHFSYAKRRGTEPISALSGSHRKNIIATHSKSMPREYEDTQRRIQLVLEQIIGSPLKTMTPENDLIADLGFQSIQIVQLFGDLQAEFKFKLRADDYVLENVASVGAIVQLVDRCRSATEHSCDTGPR
jgi:acyl carrier protein